MSSYAYIKPQAKTSVVIHNSLVIPCWILGQLMGFVLGSDVTDATISLMRTVGFQRVSIVWLLFSAILPFLLLYVIIRFLPQWMRLLLMFLKAYGFTYCVCCIASAFGSAAWLMLWLCFFTDIHCTFIFLWYMLNYNNWSKFQRRKYLLICIIIAMTFVFTDYFVISPIPAILLSR